MTKAEFLEKIKLLPDDAEILIFGYFKSREVTETIWVPEQNEILLRNGELELIP